MLNKEQKQQFSDILEELGKALDITKEQYDAAVKSYKYVGEWLSKDDSPFATYNPEILPQGSFLLQTMIRPIQDEDELDIDLVCKLEKIQASWTQFELKKLIGDRLKANGILNKLLVIPDGRRCWTLQYAESAKFHLDVLPSVVATGYRPILEKAFSSTDLADTNSLGIRITDRNTQNYRTSTNLHEWFKSNPFGYAIWFQDRCRLVTRDVRMMSEAIQAVPKYQTDKLPLQRVVQILKRHRDMMFNDVEHKPISIIITTLASKTYNKETDIIEALINVVSNMENHIEERWSEVHGKRIKWISNPVNDKENFADKWQDYPQREKNFYYWLSEVKKDLNQILGQSGRGLQYINESMAKSFGKFAVDKAFSRYGERFLQQRENGNMKMAGGTGMLGEYGRTVVPQHKPYGKK